MTEQIRQAMVECAEDPATGERLMRALLELDGDRFVRASLGLVGSDRDSPGYALLMTLLARSDQIVGQLCNPDAFSKEASIELARKLVLFDPKLDTRLVRLLPGRDRALTDPADCATIERVLELLEVVSFCARIVPALARLLGDPNPRLRAKAALLLGRRVQNSRLIEICLQQEDPRVRANAIESLWSGANASSTGVLRLAAKDTNNRVVGNALWGLYQVQDLSAASLIIAMGADPRPSFRASAAWTMGQTSDPRFLPVLEKLARDLFAPVRKNASKAMESIRAQTRTEARLQLQVLRQQHGASQRRLVSLQALGPEGDPMRGLLGSQFILWANQKLVTDYEVIEHVNTESLGVGFALCQGAGISGDLLKSAGEAVLGCLPLKAPQHHWALAKFVSTRVQPAGGGVSAPEETRTDLLVEAVAYLPDTGKLEKSIADSPVETHFAAAALAALKSLLPGAFKTRGNRHLILLAASEFIPTPEIEAQADGAVETKVAIHAVVVGRPHPSLQDLCQRTAGTIVTVDGGAGLAAAFRKLYLALTFHYKIRFQTESPINLEIYCKQGYGTCHIDNDGRAGKLGVELDPFSGTTKTPASVRAETDARRVGSAPYRMSSGR
jgi:HEAT repeat protein